MCPDKPINPMTLHEWLESSPFTLVMSSGFFGFFAHCGMLQALESTGLRPAAVAGSSAGALIAGCWAAGVDSEEIGHVLSDLERADFWDPRPGPGLLRGRAFRRRLESLLPVETFEQCRVACTVSVFDLFKLKTRPIVSGKLAPAVHASCAVPFMFHPVWLDGSPCVDGGVADRPGIAGVGRDRNVFFHHLASRSPWRLAPPAIPRRANLVPLIIEDLPRVDPFRLERGRLALAKARQATLQALQRPLAENPERASGARH
jgi:NTE family protein